MAKFLTSILDLIAEQYLLVEMIKKVKYGISLTWTNWVKLVISIKPILVSTVVVIGMQLLESISLKLMIPTITRSISITTMQSIFFMDLELDRLLISVFQWAMMAKYLSLIWTLPAQIHRLVGLQEGSGIVHILGMLHILQPEAIMVLFICIMLLIRPTVLSQCC